MKIHLDDALPSIPSFIQGIRRAPKREMILNKKEQALAVENALRYLHPKHHATLIPEFYDELMTRGRIYGYRFRPEGKIVGKPIDQYRGNCVEGRAFQVMIDNNLDFETALYPYELVTYGETGQVCQNWMQYRLIQKYLEQLTSKQTLVLHSGHPMGVFHSHELAPRVILTNGLMVGMFDQPEPWLRATALGVANYGQMTAGGWMYIGPQGIVHGTYNTLLIAGRQRLGVGVGGDLRGKLFVSSGLGGMSGAQPKAAEIAGAVCVIAEVDRSRIETRHQQKWVKSICNSPEESFKKAQEAQQAGRALSIAYHGNIVDLLEYGAKQKIKIDLLSDQTSCHAVYDGGYCPQGLCFAERTELLSKDKHEFRRRVDASLKQHFEWISRLVEQGTYFFDYGNAFMKAVFDSGVKAIAKNQVDERDGFIFPSYVEDMMGPELFDYGYGPFRWVCLSGKPEDLEVTDQAAQDAIASAPGEMRYQDRDNLNWVKNAKKNQMVVGTQARILYQDAQGRVRIALRFNELIRQGLVGPIMLGRDHHDCGGTDSPFRETANIYDGSRVMAEMATQCFAGNAARGMSLVALHNGGGVGVGKSINGGFGLVLDGSERVDQVIQMAMSWDVMGGVARRAWAQNSHAIEVSKKHNELSRCGDQITIPYAVDKSQVQKVIRS